MKISMPKACISCDHFQPQGKKFDEHCPFTEFDGCSAITGRYTPSTKTRYGRCKKHKAEVYATQLCGSHTYPVELMDVHPIANRPAPAQPIQEQLL